MNGIVVLISGRGSNLKAIYESGLGSQIKCVISNNADAPGIEFAKSKGINTLVIENKHYPNREAFDLVLANEIKKFQPQLIVLAGFMRILTSSFVQQFSNQIINIHPSLLPAFIGVNAVKQAFDYGAKITGVTVHIVTDKLDCGPILAQEALEIEENETLQALTERLLKLEHKILPRVIHSLLKSNY